MRRQAVPSLTSRKRIEKDGLQVSKTKFVHAPQISRLFVKSVLTSINNAVAARPTAAAATRTPQREGGREGRTTNQKAGRVEQNSTTRSPKGGSFDVKLQL